MLAALKTLTESAPWLMRSAASDDILFNALMKVIGYLLVTAKRISREEAGLDKPGTKHE